MSLKEEQDVVNILVTGTFAEMDPAKSPEDLGQEAIDIFKKVAETNPKHLLHAIRSVVENRIDGMVLTGLVVLTSAAPKEFFLDRKNKGTMLALLSVYEPPFLLDYVELLKSGFFGRGFGSRPQKWVRTIMEGWSILMIKEYFIKFPSQYHSLIKLVHPRYLGDRGLLVKSELNAKYKS